jgi:transposase-like protein
MAENTAPKTLLDAVKYFANPDVAHAFVASLRWPSGEVHCPRCDGTRQSFLASRRVWKCLDCQKQFSVKVGTIFEDSPLPLSKWLPAMWMLVNCKNGISSYELSRAIGVTQKTAWFMLHRIRLATQAPSFNGGPMSGHVEADETYIGGKARNMHEGKRKRVLKGRESGTIGKTAVMGLLERGRDGQASRVRAEVIEGNKRTDLQQRIRRHVKTDGETVLYTDSLKSYVPRIPKGWRPDDLYIHKVIDHAKAYVDGEVHTNGMENFWSLLKRAIKGTYVSIEPFHLFRYLDEQCFRFNERKLDDAGRFILAAAAIFGRRLMYKTLIGEPATARI